MAANTKEKDMDSLLPSYGHLPATGYVRQSQLVANPKYPERPSIVPFSSATLWRKVKDGSFPKPVSLSKRITAWNVEDVRAWLKSHTIAQVTD
jgi:prophage regulatory protein